MPPLERQLVTLPLGGIDTKTDPKQLQIGRLLELENGTFRTPGELRKRAGYVALPTDRVDSASTVSAGLSLATLGDELLLYDGEELLSYASSREAWCGRGRIVSCDVETRQIYRRGASQQLNPDVGVSVAEGVEVYAWEDSDGSVGYSVIDAETRTVLDTGSVRGAKPKLVLLGSDLYLLAYDADAIQIIAVPLDLSSLATGDPAFFVDDAVALASDPLAADDGTGYDVAISGGKLYLAYVRVVAAVAQVRLARYSGALALEGGVTVDTGAAAYDAGPSCIALARSSTRWTVAWGTGDDVRAARYALDFVATPTPTLAATSAIAQPASSVAIVATDALDAWVYATITDDDASRTDVWTATVIDSGATPHGAVVRSLGLASKPYQIDDLPHVVLAHESPLQPTYFLYRLQGPAGVPELVAKACPGVGGGQRTNGMLSEALALDASTVLVATSTRGRLVSEAHVLFSLLGVSSTRLSYGGPLRSAPDAYTLLFAGGIVRSYDGSRVGEHSAQLYPEGLTAEAAGSDGELGAGTYQYCATYEWTDAHGQIQRSAPSVPVSVDVTATNHVTVTIPMLRVTLRTDVTIVVYRTLADGSLFHRVSSTLAPIENDRTDVDVEFEDLASDDDVSANELLYTTGGVLDNAAPPPCTLIRTYQSRVILGGLEDPNVLWFSKNRFDNAQASTVPPEFSAELTIGVDPAGGPITALGTLDDKFVIFKAAAIYVLAGDGPNDSGGGELFPAPALVSGDVGCVVPSSVVEGPLGVFFVSAKGVYLLDRSLAVQYVGAPVEAYNDDLTEATSATVLPESNQIAITAGGRALVYDYQAQQWATWTNHPALDATIFGGRYVYLRSSGVVYQQDPEVFDDDGTQIQLSWTTGDIAFAGLSRFQRVYRAWLLGRYASEHQLEVHVAYDYATSYAQLSVITPAPLTDDHYRYRVDFTRQRCTAVRIKVLDALEVAGEGYAMSGITIEVGVLPDGDRAPQAQIRGGT